MVSASDVAVDKRLYISRQSESVVKSAYVSVTTDRTLDCIVRTLNHVFLNSFAVFSFVVVAVQVDNLQMYFLALPIFTAIISQLWRPGGRRLFTFLPTYGKIISTSSQSVVYECMPSPRPICFASGRYGKIKKV